MIFVIGKFPIDIMEPIIDKNFSHLRLYKNIFYTPLIISKINAHIVLRAIIIEFIGFISVCPITSPIIGLVDMLRYNKNDKNDVAAESLNSLSLQW